MSKRKKLVLIDGNSLIHRGFHAFSRLNLTSPNGENTGGVYGFTLLLLNVLNKLQPDYIAVALDSRAPTFRHKEYKEYKANRVAAPQELYDQIPRIQELLEKFNIPQFTKEGFEADDIVATLAHQAPKDIDVYIATGDMDLLQLIKDNIFVYAPRKGFSDIITFDADTVRKLKGLSPNQIVDFKGLRGDPSDNIPGVPGVGEKTALKLLQEFDTIENVYSNLDKIPERYRKLLEKHKALAIQSRRLATVITDMPIKLDLQKAELHEYDQQEVLDIFHKLGFESLIKKLPHSNGSTLPLTYNKEPSSPLITKKVVKNQADKIDERLIPVLKKMEAIGILLDIDFVAQLNQQVTKKLSILVKDIYKYAKQEFNINSPLQLATVLFEKLKLSTENIAKTKTGYSTAAAELHKLEDTHPIIPFLLEYRELEKIRNTYLETLPKMADSYGRIHTHFAQNTATGRLSSAEPNLQNIPVRTKLGAEIRKAFVAPPGYQLLSVDYSQIELKIAAHIAKDQRLIDTFLNSEDVHARTAAELEGIGIEEVTKAQRRKAKTVNFGIIYGISPHGLVKTTDMDYGEAKAYIDKYFNLHPGIRKYMKEIIAFAQQTGYVETLLGRRREIPEIDSNVLNIRLAAERTAINTPIQGTAADIIKMAMIEIDNNLAKISPETKMILQVHDELIFEVPAEDIPKVAKFVKIAMENIYKLDVPITVNIEAGPNWGDTELITNL